MLKSYRKEKRGRNKAGDDEIVKIRSLQQDRGDHHRLRRRRKIAGIAHATTTFLIAPQTPVPTRYRPSDSEKAIDTYLRTPDG